MKQRRLGLLYDFAAQKVEPKDSAGNATFEAVGDSKVNEPQKEGIKLVSKVMLPPWNAFVTQLF